MKEVELLDLFSGMGGFSYGFSKMGIKTTGVDINRNASSSYELLTNGKSLIKDLAKEDVEGNYYDIIVGGPPCRPWSSINTTKRGILHPDYPLVNRFAEHVERITPSVFLMENVPPLRNDPAYSNMIKRLGTIGYSIESAAITYSEFGASVKRKRLLIVGSRIFDANDFLFSLSAFKKHSGTVSDAIEGLVDVKRGEVPDHVWPNLNTIQRYKKYYDSGKYGWNVLKWNEAAPSFGNVMKTYTLHPNSSFVEGNMRTISVAEAARIMGFPADFIFPKDVPMGQKYQMIVDSVSPVFSSVLAQGLQKFLRNKPEYEEGASQHI